MKYLDSYNIVLLRNHLPQVVEKINKLFKLLGFKFFIYNSNTNPSILGIGFELDLKSSRGSILGYLLETGKSVNLYNAYPKINNVVKYYAEIIFNVPDFNEYANNISGSHVAYEIHPKNKSDILPQTLEKILEFFKSIDVEFKSNQGEFNMPDIQQLVNANGIVNETDLLKFLHNSVANNINSFQILKSIKDIPRNDCDSDKSYMKLKNLFKKFHEKELGEEMGELGF